MAIKVAGDLALDGSTLQFKQGTATGRTAIVNGTHVADITLTLPIVTDSLIGRLSSDLGAFRLQNKDLDDATTQFTDGTDFLKFNTGFSGTATLTAPNIAADELVGIAAAQTLTSKQLTSPGINEATVLTATSTELNQITGVSVGGIANGDILTTNASQPVSAKTFGPSNFVNNTSGTFTLDSTAAGNDIDLFPTLTSDLFIGSLSTDVVIRGNLQVDGTTTTVNSETVVVDDANIVVNNLHTQAEADAEDAGITVHISDGTDALIGYDSTLASKFAIGEVGSTKEIATVSDDQTLSNKTLAEFDFEDSTTNISANNITTGTATIGNILTGTGPINTITPATATDGLIKLIINRTGAPVTFTGGTTTEHSIATATNITLQDGDSLLLSYDLDAPTNPQWRVVGGAGGGGGLSTELQNDTFTAESGKHYLLGTAATSAYTVTLPAGATGDVIRFSDVNNDWDNNFVTLDGDGAETIDGDATLVLDVEGAWVQLMWNGTEWKTDDAIVPNSVNLTGDIIIDGTIAAEDGTAASPGFQFKDDSDNGMYRVGTDSIALSTAGTNALTIDSSQNVGVGGISTTVTKLGVQGDTDTNSQYTFRAENSSATGVFSVLNNGEADFRQAGGTVSMRVTSAGNVGIGTTSLGTDVKVTVAGSNSNGFVAVFDNSDTTADGAGGVSIDSGATTTAPVLRVTSNNGATNIIEAEASGNVGIGNSDPTGTADAEADNLVIGDSSTTTTGMTFKASNSSRTSILFSDGESGSEKFRGGISYDHGTGFGGAADTLYFRTASSLRMAIDASGYLGIGGLTPSSPLTVELSNQPYVSYFNNNNNATANKGIGIQCGRAGGVAPYSWVDFFDNSGTDGGGIETLTSLATGPSFRTPSDRRIKEDFRPIENTLERINQVKIYNFKRKDIPEARAIGPVAQELISLFPELVKQTDDGLGDSLPEGQEAWSVSKDWDYLLIKAIQELSAQITELKDQING